MLFRTRSVLVFVTITIAVTGFLCGCSESDGLAMQNKIENSDSLSPDISVGSSLSDDFLNGFYIFYSTGQFSFDTRNNKMGKECISPFGYIYVDYYMPREKLKEIYDFIIQYDIKSYSGSALIALEDVWMSPSVNCTIEFYLDGEIYSFCYNSVVCYIDVNNPNISFPEKYLNLRAFDRLIVQSLDYPEEFNSLPPGILYY